MAESLQISVHDQMADVTECSICTEIFTNPKSLPCLHSFCFKCLEKYLKDKKPGDQMVCPICRSNFVIPKGGFCNLPNNFFIGKMVEIRKLSKTTTVEALCSTCPEEERVKAKLFCFECDQNLCERCGVTHSKMKLSQHHQVGEIGKKPQEVNFRNSYCDQHPGKIIKMFCEDDKATICILCFAENHQTHKCLSVTKASEALSSALKDDLKTVKRRLPECKASFEKLKTLKTDMLAEIAEVQNTIFEEATRLKALIDSHVNMLMQQLTAIKDKKLKEIESTQQDVEGFQATIESYTRYLDELLNKGAPGDICRDADRMKKRAQALTVLPGICCDSDCCWDKIVFKSLNLEAVLRINNITNAIGVVQAGSSNFQLLGHSNAVYQTNSKMQTVSPTRHSETGAAKPKNPRRTIVVQNIPPEIDVDVLLYVFENQRWGGGETEEIQFQKGRETAFITFKDSAVADALALKESVSVWGNLLLIKKL